MTTFLSIQDIMALIPHRYPFLLIDRVEGIQGTDEAIGIKNVTMNEPFFMGHFPGNPIMPGVLIVEAMAQTAGAIVAKHLSHEDTQKSVLFMGIEKARFRKPVLPGHQLLLKVKKRQNRGAVWKYEGFAHVGDTLHAEATFTAMITSAPET